MIRFAICAHACTPGSLNTPRTWVNRGWLYRRRACGERDGVRGLYATKDVPKARCYSVSRKHVAFAPRPSGLCRASHDGALRSLSRERKVYTTVARRRAAVTIERRRARGAAVPEAGRGRAVMGPSSTRASRVCCRSCKAPRQTRWAERMVSRYFLQVGAQPRETRLAGNDGAGALLDLANHRTPDLGEVEPVGLDPSARR